jgi:hypothetical protein
MARRHGRQGQVVRSKGQGRRAVLWSPAIFVAIGVAACSPPPSPEDQTAAIRSATATALPDQPAAQFVISGFSRGPAKSSWKVAVGDKHYVCDADELLRLPECKPEA